MSDDDPLCGVVTMLPTAHEPNALPWPWREVGIQAKAVALMLSTGRFGR